VQLDTRITLKSPKATVKNLRLVVSGEVIGESAGPANFTAEAASEIGGVNYRFTKGGSNTWPILTTDFAIISDVCGNAGVPVALPANSTWFIRYGERVATFGDGMAQPFISGNGYAKFANYNNNAGSRVAGTGVIVDSQSGVARFPIAILGDVVPGSITSIGFDGTSIEAGFGDSGVADSEGKYGWIDKGLDAYSANLPRMGLARSGQTLSATGGYLSTGLGRQSLYPYFDVIVCGGWTNDLQSGGSFAQLQADVTTYIGRAKSGGRKLYMATMMPRTNSTNVTPSSVAFTGGTPGTAANARNDYNILLEALSDAGTIDGVIDVSLGRYKLTGGSWVATGGGVEDPVNLNFWTAAVAADAGFDGTHPRTTGAAAAAVPLTALATALGW
jgi:hypothetical protein